VGVILQTIRNRKTSGTGLQRTLENVTLVPEVFPSKKADHPVDPIFNIISYT